MNPRREYEAWHRNSPPDGERRMNFLRRYKTLLGGLGLLGLAIYQLSMGQLELAATSLAAGLVALGILDDARVKNKS